MLFSRVRPTSSRSALSGTPYAAANATRVVIVGFPVPTSTNRREPIVQRVGDGATARELGLDDAPLEFLTFVRGYVQAELLRLG